MRRRPKQTLIEGGFLLFLVVLCAILTTLQYRWTGELSRAAAERMRTSLSDQAHLLGRAFDAELLEDCNELLPRAEELNARGYEAAHLERYRTWLAGKPRPIFRRLCIAVFEHEALQLYGLDQKSIQLAPVEWPAEWAALRENLTVKAAGGRAPPFENPTGVLLEFPIFLGARQPRPVGERGWMILELDLDYLRETWLPELVRAYLNAGDRALEVVVVKTLLPPKKVIYSTGGSEAIDGSERAVALQFNRQGRAEDDRQLRGDTSRWLLTAWHRPDALEAVVSTLRWRNLGLAWLLNGLMLASGVALVHFTRRSRQLAEAQMKFVANVSHELRTPLTVIRGAAHNLSRGVVREPGKIEQYAKLIIQHADGLAGMVEQVLELTAARKKQLSAGPREPVALAEILRAAIAATTPDAACCEMQADIPADLPAVHGDASALRRAFQNLLTNAAKHGGHDGCSIRLKATCVNGKEPPMLEVEITDQGPGISKEEQLKIFQPFFRGAAAQTQETRGSGLGLSLVREIVEAHGGSVTVRSRQGEGATFTVRLPVAKAEEANHSPR